MDPPPQKSSPHIAFVCGTNISEFLDPPSNSAKAKAWARARARVETRPRANARARVRDMIRARATELGLEGGNNFRGVQIKRDRSTQAQCRSCYPSSQVQIHTLLATSKKVPSFLPAQQ